MKRPRRRSRPWLIVLLGANLLVLLVLQAGLMVQFNGARAAASVPTEPAVAAPRPMPLLDAVPEPAAEPLPPAPALQRASAEPSPAIGPATPAAMPIAEAAPAPNPPVRMVNYQQVRTDLMDVADALVRLNARLVEAQRPGVAER